MWNYFCRKKFKNLEKFQLSVLNILCASGGTSVNYDISLFTYFCSKTKGDKYLLETNFKIIHEYEIIYNEKRCYNKIDFNDYYYIENKTKMYGYERSLPEKEEENIFNDINEIYILSGDEEIKKITDSKQENPLGEDFLLLFKYINIDN